MIHDKQQYVSFNLPIVLALICQLESLINSCMHPSWMSRYPRIKQSLFTGRVDFSNINSVRLYFYSHTRTVWLLKGSIDSWLYFFTSNASYSHSVSWDQSLVHYQGHHEFNYIFSIFRAFKWLFFLRWLWILFFHLLGSHISPC